MHRVVALLEGLWPNLLIGLVSFLLFWLFHVRGLDLLRWGRRSKQTEELAKMSEPATRCEVCLRETTMQCSRCKVVKYCSAECQRKHWHKGGHKTDCQPKPKGGAHANGHAKKGLQKGKLKPAPEPKNALAKQMLFPYEEFVDMFNWDGLVREPCGLMNVGNSCYANAVLQCLTYTWPLARYLLGREHGQDCEKARSKFCFLCELEVHVIRALEGSKPIMPQRILGHVRNVGASLGYGRQEDAHEFMRFAVDSMQATFLEEAGGEKNIDHVTQETTLVHHIFGGKLQSQVKCMTCLAESNTYESVLDLTVEITGSVNSLEGALHTFTSPEWLDGDNKYKCDKCEAYVKGCKRLSIHEGPNMLSIVLKRFQGGHFGKVNKAISFPETLNLTPFISGKSDRPGPYHLYAVIVHVDLLNSTFFGHYLCFVKDASGRWYEADDSDVRPTTLERVLAQKAYMLFYARSEPRAAPLIQPPTRANRSSQNGTAQTPKVHSGSRSSSPSSVLTAECTAAHSNGDGATSAFDGNVNGRLSSDDAPPASGPNGVTSPSKAGENRPDLGAEERGSVTEGPESAVPKKKETQLDILSRLLKNQPPGPLPDDCFEKILEEGMREVALQEATGYAKGVVGNMLAEADAEGVLTPSEGVGIVSDSEASAESAKGSGSVSSVEQDEGGQFADSVILEEPYPSAANREPERDGGESERVGRSSTAENGAEVHSAKGRAKQLVDERRSGSTGRKEFAKNGTSSQPASMGEANPRPGWIRGPFGSDSWFAGGTSRGGATVPKSRGKDGPVGEEFVQEGRARTAAGVEREHPTAQSERAESAGAKGQKKEAAGGKGHLMESTPAPALVSHTTASRGAPVWLTSSFGKADVACSNSDVAGSESLSGSGESETSFDKVGGIGGELLSENGVRSGGADLHRAEKGSPPRSPRGKKRSTGGTLDESTPEPEASGERGSVAEGPESAVPKKETQLDILSRLLRDQPPGPLPDDYWDKILEQGCREAGIIPFGGSANPPLPDELFLEDEAEPLFLADEKANLLDRFLSDGAQHAEMDLPAGDTDLGKNEETGPFGLGSVPFTPVFTSQPSGKESGWGRHGGSVSGLARGFFGAPKGKRKSDKRPVRTSEVASGGSVPLRDEHPSLGAGFGEGRGDSAFGVGSVPRGETPFAGEVPDVAGESAHFSDDLTDELVLTTDTSTDEKKSSGANVKPKGIADLIDNEELLREVGKSADQRLRSVVKGKVEVKAKQGRNDVCNCGSGKKWKKCHGKGVKE